MGIFQHKPEEPTPWAGLPGEPWEPRNPAERLEHTPSADLPLMGTPGSTSIVDIPLDLGMHVPVADPGETTGRSDDE
jgi:hypothetical protein